MGVPEEAPTEVAHGMRGQTAGTDGTVEMSGGEPGG